MCLKTKYSIPAQMFFYLVITLSIVKENFRKCEESQIFNKYEQNLFLQIRQIKSK